jgi:hypothetical protein
VDITHPYWVAPPSAERREVEAWAGYPVQFDHPRRRPWQAEMVLELKAALAALEIAPSETLSGVYISTDVSRCDTENRLFTNPGTSTFPKGVTAIRFERGAGPIPQPPASIASVAGHLYYYRYRVHVRFDWWEPAETLARWHRVPRPHPADGSGRPIWFAMKLAALAGNVEVVGKAPAGTEPFGIRLCVHATAQGPRSAPAISETFVDGAIAAFHARAANAGAVARLLSRGIPGASPELLETLVSTDGPGPLFATSPFMIGGTSVQISPCDERCYAGEVAIQADASGRLVEISGELFTLRRTAARTPATWGLAPPGGV